MSDPSDPSQASPQFDRAEFADGANAGAKCASCGQALWDAYYQVNGRLACERCKADAELLGSQGSGVGRFSRATVYGLLAGGVGAGIWYAVRAVTDYEVGIIAIAVGAMVGTAVKKGSGGRGGWLYQALAMFLTYGAIVSTYAPLIVKQFVEQAKAEPSKATGQEGSPTSPVALEPAAAPAAETSPSAPIGPGTALLAVGLFAALVLAIAFVAPFLGGFENIMGIVIIGIGLYEAWKINKRTPLEVAGPFRVAISPPAGTTPGV